MDHFDLPTLMHLDKSKPVLIPDDELSIASLKKLGFVNIHPMKPFSPLVLQNDTGTVSLYPTPSVSDDFLEYGLLVVEETSDGRHVVFNQVDTPLSDDCIARIQEIAPQIDVHLAMYASQDFGWFASQTSDIAQSYTQNLYAAQKIGARVVVPAAAGFRFVDRYQYLNQLLFPISEDRFVSDLRQIAPEIRCYSILPGEFLNIATTIEKGVASDGFVEMMRDDRYLLHHDPTVPIPPLQDENTLQIPLPHLHMYAQKVVGEALLAYIRGSIEQGEESVLLYCTYGATYQVKVVFPDGASTWNFVFSADDCVCTHNPDPPTTPDALYHLTGSALLGFCEGKKSCWAIRPDSRKWSRLLAPKMTPLGLRSFEVELPDLLTRFVLNLRMRMRGEQLAQLEYYGLA